MKKYTYILLIAILPLFAKAQVGIGTTTPHPSAALEIRDGDRGLLIPRVTSTGAINQATAANGLLVFAEDEGKFYVYDTIRGAWQGVNPFATNSATRVITPEAPYTTVSGNFSGDFSGNASGNFNGQVAGNLNASGTNTFSGNGTIPIGGIIMWSGTTAPTGWAICNGQTSNGRRTPNLSGRFIVGYNPGNTEYNAPGKTGGDERVALLATELPPHRHELGSNSADAFISGGSHTHNVADMSANRGGDGRVITRGENWDETYDYQALANTHTHPTSEFSGNTGNGQNLRRDSHENRPPYYVLAYIMRVQ